MKEMRGESRQSMRFDDYGVILDWWNQRMSLVKKTAMETAIE